MYFRTFLLESSIPGAVHMQLSAAYCCDEKSKLYTNNSTEIILLVFESQLVSHVMLTNSCLSFPTFVPPLSLLPVVGYHQHRCSGLLNAVWGYRSSPSGSKLQRDLYSEVIKY